MQQIGKRIKAMRISKNLKQKTIADKIGMSLTAYSNIESGKTASITLLRLNQIAAALETDTQLILDLADNNNPSVLALQKELQQAQDELQKANIEIGNLRGGVIKIYIIHNLSHFFISPSL